METIPPPHIYDKLVGSLGWEAASRDPQVLESYSRDDSFAKPLPPALVAWPRSAADVQLIVRFAAEHGAPVIAVSSAPGYRQRGDTVPTRPGSLVMDLSKMNSILRIDRKNRVAMVEPGVTFGQLIPEVERQGLRLLQPLCPRKGKSVLASALEREPVTIPRYHWDASDPLLCTELVFGTGDLFRTGSAAGPGTLEEQLAAGSAQKNPMGPTQFSLFQTVQGAQGTLAIATWATLKCELKPSLQKVRYAQADDLGGLRDFAHGLLKFRIGDELMIMNRRAFSSLAAGETGDPQGIMPGLREWLLVAVLSGRGESAGERVAYLESDLAEIARRSGASPETGLDGISNEGMLAALSSACERPWQYRSRGACQPIFFITTLDRADSFVGIARETLRDSPAYLRDFGVYIQPLLQGCNCHLEFQLHYNPKSGAEVEETARAFTSLSRSLMEGGAFFSRPYGEWAAGMFERVPPETIETLRRVKRIFDPKGILKPGALCFQEVSQ